MKNCIRRAKAFSRKPIHEQQLYFEAALLLIIFRVVIQIVPFRHIVDGLGMHMTESPFDGEPDVYDFLSTLSKCITTWSRLLPCECKCLVQAITAKKMLDLRHIKSTLYLGVKKEEGNLFCAHAWVRAGNNIITGDNKLEEYTVVSMFS